MNKCERSTSEIWLGLWAHRPAQSSWLANRTFGIGSQDLPNNSGSLAMFAAITFSSQEKTARAKPFAQLDLLPSSSETDHPCSRSVFAALGSCPRHKKVPPPHPAGMCHQDGSRPDPVCVS